jgi:hypothetical protein
VSTQCTQGSYLWMICFSTYDGARRLRLCANEKEQVTVKPFSGKKLKGCSGCSLLHLAIQM